MLIKLFNEFILGKALEFAMDNMFNASNGDRPNANNILVVLTDGKSTDVNDTAEQAQLIHSTSSVKVFAIGIKNYDFVELMAIASDPHHVFTVDDFSALNSIKDEVQVTRTDCAGKFS